jgi:hypothetical protein
VDKQCELEFGAGFKLCPYKDQVRGGVSVGVFLLFSRIPLSARLRRLVVHLQRRLRLPLQLAAVGRRHLVRQGPLVPPRGVHPARQEAAHAGHRRMGTLATVSYHQLFVLVFAVPGRSPFLSFQFYDRPDQSYEYFTSGSSCLLVLTD